MTFHLWKCELWPLEKWPLILTGPNGAWRTASDRRQMETQDACKDRRTCAGGHRDTLIEWPGLGCRPEEWRENRGDGSQAGLGFHRKLLRHAGHVCFHVYWPSRHRSGDKHMHSLRAQQQTGLLLTEWRLISSFLVEKGVEDLLLQTEKTEFRSKVCR